MATTLTESFGANPINTQWVIVRGDTSVLRVEFYNNDEVTPFDTSTWECVSSVYDFKGDTLQELDTVLGDGYVEITATSYVTEEFGKGFRGTVAELAFDLQITIEDVVWTPVIGTIKVLADVTGGSL